MIDIIFKNIKHIEKLRLIIFGKHPYNTLFNYNWLLIRIIIKDLKKINQVNNTIVNGTFVDVGAGNLPYFDIFKKNIRKYIAIDLPDIIPQKCKSELIELMPGDIYNIPLQDNFADISFSSQVFYALINPELAIKEMARITKAGGFIILTVPHIMPLITEPYDYYRFTPNIFEEYAKDNNLELVNCKFQGNVFTSMGLLLNMNIVLSEYDINRKNFHLTKLLWICAPIIFLINLSCYFLSITIGNFLTNRCPTNFLVIYKK